MPGAQPSPGPAPRILLVEDNEAAIIQIRAVLEQDGYILDVARGGYEALDYISHTIPDGIILDLMMPEIDGFAVLETIRGTRETAGIPVLILTAKDLTPEDLKRLSSNHIQQLIQKGDVDREQLLSKVRSIIETHPEPAMPAPAAAGPAHALTGNHKALASPAHYGPPGFEAPREASKPAEPGAAPENFGSLYLADCRR